MSDNTFPFRRETRLDPFIIPCVLTPAPLAIPKAQLTDYGVSSFKMANPNPFWVWYRGWNGAAGDMPTIAGKGHYIAPGAVDVNTSQIPDWIAAVAAEEPGFPLTDAQGGFLYPEAHLVMLYGGGG